MRMRFVEEARLEFLDAISYYKKQQPALARRFKVEIKRSTLWLADSVEACGLRPGGYGRLNLQIFPNYIPYIVRGSTLWVLAIAPSGENPNTGFKGHGHPTKVRVTNCETSTNLH